MATKTPKYRGIENKQYARDIHGLRSSGAAGVMQDERDRRARTRSASLRRDLKDQGVRD